MTGSLVAIILLPLLVGTLVCAWAGRGRGPAARLGASVPAGLLAIAVLGILAQSAPEVLSGQQWAWKLEWVPAIGLDLSFRLDPLSWMFSALIAGIGLLIVVYAAYYLGPDDPPGKFFASLMLFMAAMLGIAISDNLLQLLVFWELTSLASFLLIGYWGSREESRAGARMALAVTGGGGLVMLAGFILLGQIGGSYDISVLAGRVDTIQGHDSYPLALVLVLVGCFTKSAQLPFHFWLPQAMAAPTPVSAYLHSATMVKAGLFLMMRLYPVLGGTALFEGIVAPVGLATMVFAAFVAIFKHDLKGLLAYSTVSHLGLVTFLIGLSSQLSMAVAVFHILNHAAFKAALFMSAGIVDHETRTRDMRRLGGLMVALPMMGTLTLLAAAAMAGLPPFNGFISKEMMLAEAVQAGPLLFGGHWPWLVPAVATLGGLFSVVYSLRLVHDTYFGGPPRDLPNAHPHEPPWGMKAPVVLLVAVCIVVGLAPALVEPLVRVVAGAALGQAGPEVHLALWHGVNLPLALSALAVLGGAAAYVWARQGGRIHRYQPTRWSARAAFDAGMSGLLGAAGWLTRLLESAALQRYLAWMVAAAVAAAAWPFLRSAGPLPAGAERGLTPASPVAIGVWLLLLAVGIWLLRAQRQRFIAVVLTGAVGLVASLTFVVLSAPDLAMTQLSVDVVSTVLLLMGLALLPQYSPVESPAARRWGHGALAAAAGGGIAWLTWLMLTRDFDSISWFFLEQSKPAGGGTNVVNVILVDFRGYDTFGEITVLGIAGVGVLALLDGLRLRRPQHDDAGRPWSYRREPLMLRTVAGWLLPLGLVVAAYVFWRGHNLPGGGFIAGLIASVALVLQYMARGQQGTEAALRAGGGARYTRWVGIGLGIAWLTGVGAFLWGRPFMTSAHAHPSLPLVGEVGLATAALFDLGVFVTVLGATMLMLAMLGQASKESGARPGGSA